VVFEPNEPGLVAGVQVDVPACPPTPTTPTFTAEVARCADENGGAIAVTMTNPPGGPEEFLQFTLNPDPPRPVEWTYWYDGGVGDPAVRDGEQMTVVVDELGSTGAPARFRGLVAGDYTVYPHWSVSYPHDPAITSGAAGGGQVDADPIHVTVPACAPSVSTVVRVAAFDVGLSRAADGGLVADLTSGEDAQATEVAEIIQRIRPDVVVLNDFDVSPDTVDVFRADYLEVAHNGAEPIEYPFVFTAAVNSGVASGFDLDNDGTVGGPADALGFGDFPGQHGMVILSRYPIADDQVRTFQHLLWTAMPEARLPDDAATPEPGDWYSADELAVVPLASASMWDVPVDADGTVIHVLASQATTPTAPTPDGVASPAALRNADEIRFWADYIASEDTTWIVDDAGVAGGLAADTAFVIVGDLGADPVDGDSIDEAIQQLLDLDVIQDPQPASDGATEAAELQAGANAAQQGDPALDTADLADDPAPGNLRTDYVLASDGLDIVDAAVFWPASDDPLAPLVAGDPPTTSDHRMVWVDLTTATTTPETTAPGATTEAPPSTPAGYGFDDFYDVPQLGHEAVRGTGCGGDGSIGDVIPDGWWRGFVRSWDGPSLEQSTTLQFDLICIYLNPVGDVQIVDGWLVNNNDRTRTVPIAPGLFAHGTAFVGDAIDAPFDQPDVPFESGLQVWLRIVDGAAVWAVSSPISP
jgi:hypothetical protein